MSTTHRPGDGSGYYPPGDVLARQRQEEAAPGWGSGYYPQGTARSWAGGGEMAGAAGAQNSPYPGYDPSGWSCAGQPRPPYTPAYTVGGQGMEHYANGSYGPPYNQSAMNPPYPGLHPANPYYPPPSQPHYPVDPYKSAMQQGAPQAPSHWGYPQQGCPSIPQQHPPYPQYPPPQGPRDDSWNMYGAPNHYQWHSAPPQNPNGTQYMPGGRPPWPGGDVQSPVYDVKDTPQNPGYNHQRQFPGYSSDIPQSCQPSEPKPNLPPPNPHYSASPQMYNRKEPSNPEPIPRSKEGSSSPPDPSSGTHPGILKITQVLERVVDMEREVDEFVGKKTDMSYRCLEEMLTKELLELDSVETGGQESIRQARKEAVKKLQSILERLEKKGL
ncbi:BAG family molecular chaperone regulator 4 isoform X1 [Bufo gargarizans]|uniref:BAG family molecular chaperone regulator 4 isoform X1 n=1 Tax=Bufo gargarizans TaxID=30331 RepID=UPI001CF38CD8|nr:BAG family molecular chaperone regulator 4 isoform X1 [Bufo gargarizans]